MEALTGPIIQLYQILGCDLNVIPTSDYEALVLVLHFLAVSGFLFALIHSMFKLCFAGVRRF